MGKRSVSVIRDFGLEFSRTINLSPLSWQAARALARALYDLQHLVYFGRRALHHDPSKHYSPSSGFFNACFAFKRAGQVVWFGAAPPNGLPKIHSNDFYPIKRFIVG